MKLHLRFGMHRDVQLMHEEKDRYDGFVIPAHILAHQPASTSVFVTSLYDKPYVIDPMTFILQNPKESHVNDKGEIRPSIGKLFSEYHPSLIAKLLSLDDGRALLPSEFPDIEELTANCVRFQLTKVAAEAGESGAAKYLKRYKRTKPTAPRCVIPPYFHFVNTEADRFYAMSLDCARSSAKHAEGIDIAPVVLCPASALRGAGAVATIVGDYSGFRTVILWIDSFAQGQASIEDIVGVRRLVHGLSAVGVEVEALYGGYLMAMMAFDGLKAISHGILYTQHKAFTLTPGSGGAPERYYIPGIWDFRSMSQTDIILHQHRELMCKCAVCGPVLDDDPDNIIKFIDDPELLRRHFLCVRRQELNHVIESNPKAEAALLRAAHARYHRAFLALPNPDAMVSNATIQGLDYLNNWASSVSAEL